MGQNKEFTVVPVDRVKRNHFDLSHDVKLSFDMGYLIPTMTLFCMPGDSFTIGCDSLLRFAPLVAPVMHMFNVTTHYFFVPYRLLWPNWGLYFTNGDDGDDIPAFPYFTADLANTLPKTLFDYLGVPTLTADHTLNINAMPPAAYCMIRDEYYRDQNLQELWRDGLTGMQQGYYLKDGDNTSSWPSFPLFKRSWMHDYFTSCLPFAQKGMPVDIPLGSLEDVPVYRNNSGTDTTLTGSPVNQEVIAQLSSGGIDADALYAETSGVNFESTTIADLRRAYAVQRWLEKNARGGTRQIEMIFEHFGVRSSDKRLQRPEYITGTKSPVVISEVLNTTGTADAPQGNMAGHAVSVTNGKYGKYFCEEHGIIMAITSVMPVTAYQQGIDRQWLLINDPTELPWPSFAHIGEQNVFNAEIFSDISTGDGSAQQFGTFGYIPRFSEYKYMRNRTCGDFKDTLAFWTCTRVFTALPELNSDFIECVPRLDIFAVETEDNHLWCQVLHRVHAKRPLPKFSNPI